jgi:hypothetical protein
MGLFDKKKKGRDDFDSPVEHVDLGASTGPVAAAAAPPADPDEAETVDRPGLPSATRPRPGLRRYGARPTSAPAPYGIDEAVALMRSLPDENIELVVQVVRQTLESAHIDIRAILQDAASRQEAAQARMQVLRDGIAELEAEIEKRRGEIAQLEAEDREITQVKERLILAERLSQGGRADTLVDAPAPRASESRRRAGRPSSPPVPVPVAAEQTPLGGTAATAAPKK